MRMSAWSLPVGWWRRSASRRTNETRCVIAMREGRSSIAHHITLLMLIDA